ncbi:ABC transporter permease [Paenibacillus xylanilyticus]|uniref:ABC transporter permease n=1 Tax=Paenibacillus xylanilyticus TaxID=248903 RepID=A0A7Y6BTA0_9BACL|nr:ABC transporter permease [Paenibacillus xylanilyticus]NUU74406.1 ABC transporter permease [Paenibacillus xylanilyticus]
MSMLLAQSRVEMLRMARNVYFVFWSLLMPVVFYVLYTRIFTTNAVDAKEWNAHYLMSMTCFSVMGSSIMTLGIRLVQERVHGWVTYLRVTPLPDSIYFGGKMIGQTAIHLCSIIIIFASGYLINGVSLTASQWIDSALWILAGSLPFLALGTCIGTFRRVDTASGLSNALYLSLALLGGMWMPLDVMPSWLAQIGTWLPSHSYGNGAWVIIIGGVPELRDILLLAAYLGAFMLLSTYIRSKQKEA